MKAILEFDLSTHDDTIAHQRAISATNAYIALFRIQEEIFHPSQKYGYDNKEIQEILNSLNKLTIDGEQAGTRLINILSRKFREIVEQYQINFNDLEQP